MKVQINPVKPFYIDKDNKILRMGNFPETGKLLEDINKQLVDLFNIVKEPIDYNLLIEYMCNSFDITKDIAEENINYLIDEGFLILSETVDNILKDRIYNRELLYFLMTSNKNFISDFNRVKHKNILILGLGGIGSIAINLLTRAGFDNFTVVDYDRVEENNLIRQLSYDINDIGKLKVDAINGKMSLINKNVNISSTNINITKESDVEKQIEKCDFVLCTVDKPIRLIRRLINDICVKYNKPVLFCGFTEHYGIVGPFVVPKLSACLMCIENYNKSDDLFNTALYTPSYGPLCNTIASIAVDEIINYFLKYKEFNLIGKSMMFNMLTYDTKIEVWKKDDKCERCGSK